VQTNDYKIITHWRVPGTVEDVSAILRDPRDLPRWWPAVYLDVQELEPGDAQGLGKVVSLYTKGWLPYTLRWQFRVTDVHPNGLSLEAWGDLVGRGIWTFVQDGPDVLVVYDWQVRADKGLLKNLAWLMKPIFTANHNWAMARGEQSLKLELARRQAAGAAERALVPAPPPPTPSAGQLAPMALAGLAGLAGLRWWLRRRGRRP
jgi:hypothetical protein